MRGLVRFALFSSLSLALVVSIAQKANITLDPMSVIAGLTVAALVGVANMGWEWWIGAITRPFNRQIVVHQTPQSPWDVYRGASCALVKGGCVILFLVFGFVLWFLFFSGFDLVEFLQVLFSAIAQEFGISP